MSTEAPYFTEAERDRLFSVMAGIDPKMTEYYANEGDRSSLVFAHLAWMVQLYADLIQAELSPVDIDDPDSFANRVGLTDKISDNVLGGISDYLTDASLRMGGEFAVKTPGNY